MSDPTDDSAPLAAPASLDDVFSTKRPKDAKAGFSSGAQSIVKGIVGGVVGVVAAPVAGAATGGVSGMAKGLVAGVAGLVVLPITGIAVGTVQMGRGIKHQAAASRATSEGKVWNEVTREWDEVPDGQIVTAESAKTAREKVQGQFRKAAGGVDYYEVLGLKPDATQDQIKRQYYVMAKKHHPDKNPGDAEAHAKFQMLGEAYQVLGDETMRKRYDAHGAEGLDGKDFMEGMEFFGMLFGNEQFEDLIGELLMAAAARSGNTDKAQIKKMQEVRIDKLSRLLRERLAPLDAAAPDSPEAAAALAALESTARQQALKLVRQSFGQTMLNAIGRVYVRQADIALAGFFGGMAERFKATKAAMGDTVNLAKAAVRLQEQQEKLAAFEKEVACAAMDGEAAAPGQKPELTKEQMAKKQQLEDAILPMMLDAMWAANVMDINSTLGEVCDRVLSKDESSDKKVDKKVLKARAEGVKVLGRVFMEAQATESMRHMAHKASDADTARQQMQNAMMNAQEKAQGFTTEQ